MSDREEFEKALALYESKCVTGSSALVRKIASHFYDVRQPEIDALKAGEEVSSRILEMQSEDISRLAIENSTLVKENNDIKECLDGLLIQFADVQKLAAATTPPVQSHIAQVLPLQQQPEVTVTTTAQEPDLSQEARDWYAKRRSAKQPAQSHQLDDADIRTIALDCGFKLKPQPDGLEDLNPYVYRFAREILSTAPRAEDDNSKLKEAAEEIESRLRNAGLEYDADYLRAALEGK